MHTGPPYPWLLNLPHIGSWGRLCINPTDYLNERMFYRSTEIQETVLSTSSTTSLTRMRSLISTCTFCAGTDVRRRKQWEFSATLYHLSFYGQAVSADTHYADFSRLLFFAFLCKSGSVPASDRHSYFHLACFHISLVEIWHSAKDRSGGRKSIYSIITALCVVLHEAFVISCDAWLCD